MQPAQIYNRAMPFSANITRPQSLLLILHSTVVLRAALIFIPVRRRWMWFNLCPPDWPQYKNVINYGATRYGRATWQHVGGFMIEEEWVWE